MSSDVEVPPIEEIEMETERRGSLSAGAALRRGSGLRAFLQRVRQAEATAIWLPVVGKVLVAALALGSIAWLGQQAEDENAYGQRVDMEKVRRAQRAVRPDEALEKADGAHAKKVEEASAPEPDPCDESEPDGPSGVTADGKVILNAANRSEFTRLRGVGEKRAEAIVVLRERLGKFRKVSDLLRVRGIGWKTLQKLKSHVLLDRPPEEEKSEESKENREKPPADTRNSPE